MGRIAIKPEDQAHALRIASILDACRLHPGRVTETIRLRAQAYRDAERGMGTIDHGLAKADLLELLGVFVPDIAYERRQVKVMDWDRALADQFVRMLAGWQPPGPKTESFSDFERWLDEESIEGKGAW
jgi:hypothetical protein